MFGADPDAGAWLKAVVESSSDAILSKTLDGIITSWNIGAEKLFGFTAGEAIGKPITIIIPDDRLEEEASIIARLRAGERIEQLATTRRRNDGELIDIEVTISPVRDAKGDIIGASKIARGIGERVRYTQEQELLLREMQHRIKNLLSTIQALVRIGPRHGSIDEFVSDLSSRIAALDAAQNLVLLPNETSSTEGTAEASLSGLIDVVLTPYRDAGRIRLSPCEITVGKGSATSLALLFHELATNAVKYGGLSTPDGILCVGFEYEDDDIIIRWCEKGGCPDEARSGFGTKLVRAAIRGLEASMEVAWEGVERVVTLRIPARSIAR